MPRQSDSRLSRSFKTLPSFPASNQSMIHKLCFIHVNRCVLNNNKWKYTKKLYELSEEKELMLENTLLEMEVSTALQPQPDVSKRARMN